MKKNIFELKPTQFALGLREVDAKIKKLKGFTAAELEDYLRAHPIPVVKQTENLYHLIDHHHLVRACWELDLESVHVDLVDDLSEHDEDTFWKKMKQLNYVHLFDQFGKGPHDHALLPLDIRCLADDPFRSLAWMIREEGLFEKTKTPFSEFKWADLFREHITIERTDHGFERAKKEAMKIARSPQAKHLPGYKG